MCVLFFLNDSIKKVVVKLHLHSLPVLESLPPTLQSHAGSYLNWPCMCVQIGFAEKKLYTVGSQELPWGTNGKI